jgi:hypothetical protein
MCLYIISNSKNFECYLFEMICHSSVESVLEHVIAVTLHAM